MRDINAESAIQFVNNCLIRDLARELSDYEKVIILGTWKDESYKNICSRIAKEYRVSPHEVDVRKAGSKLFEDLTKLWDSEELAKLGDSKVRKVNFRATAKHMWLKQQSEAIPTTDVWQQLWNNAKSRRITVCEWGQPAAEVADFAEFAEFGVRFTWGTRVFFRIDLQQPGFLILLLKSASGRVYCLSPSFYLCNWEDERLKLNFPDIESESARSYVTVARGHSGTEKLLAIILKKKVDLEWLPSKEDKPRNITDGVEQNLQELLESIRDSGEDCKNLEMYKAEYDVISSS